MVSDDKALLEKSIGIYNKTYQAGFALAEFTEEEVGIGTKASSRAIAGEIYALCTMYRRTSAS